MNVVAKFDKVSFDQFLKDAEKVDCHVDYTDPTNLKQLKTIYENIGLPKRGTKQSAGYDFQCPFNIVIEPGEKMIIPTGIRCKIEDWWVLNIYLRSSMGIKKDLFIPNITPVIDADYYYADNEGHIMICIKNLGKENITVKSGDNFVQGVFLPFGITSDDDVTTERTGGIGSTGR